MDDATQTLEWGPPACGCRLSISTDRSKLPAEHPVRLCLVTKNEGRRDVPYVAQSVWDDYEFEVRTEGEAAPLTRFGQLMNDARSMDRSIGRTIAAGEQQVEEIHLDRYFDMTTSGKYEIRARRLVVDPETDVPAKIESNTLTVQVVED